MANEKRLIELDLAIAKIKDDGILGTGYSDDERIDDVCDMLESCPTVNAVEVVPCIKCKHYDPESEYCQFWHGVRHPGHYCGEGDNHEQG